MVYCTAVTYLFEAHCTISLFHYCDIMMRGVKVKVKVHTLDIAPLRSESPPQKRSCMARVLKGFHSFTCTPTRSSAIGMSHTCLCLYKGCIEEWSLTSLQHHCIYSPMRRTVVMRLSAAGGGIWRHPNAVPRNSCKTRTA